MIKKLHITFKILIILLFFYLGIIYDRGATEYAEVTKRTYSASAIDSGADGGAAGYAVTAGLCYLSSALLIIGFKKY